MPDAVQNYHSRMTFCRASWQKHPRTNALHAPTVNAPPRIRQRCVIRHLKCIKMNVFCTFSSACRLLAHPKNQREIMTLLNAMPVRLLWTTVDVRTLAHRVARFSYPSRQRACLISRVPKLRVHPFSCCSDALNHWHTNSGEAGGGEANQGLG